MSPRAILRSIVSTALTTLSLIAVSQAQEEVNVGISVPTLSNFFFNNFVDEATSTAVKLGGVTIAVANADFDSLKQFSDIESLIGKGVDAIIVAPVDTQGIVPVIEKAVAAGIGILIVIRPVNVDGLIGFVGPDLALGGAAIATVVTNEAPDGAHILHFRGVADSQISSGLDSVFRLEPDLFPVMEADTQFNIERVVEIAREELQKNANEPQVVIADSDDMALAAAQVVLDSNLSNVKIFGVGGSQSALDAIKSGTLTGTLELYPGQQGHIAIELVVDSIRNKQTPITNTVLVRPNVILSGNLDLVYVDGSTGDNGCSKCTEKQVCCKGECKESCMVPQELRTEP